MRITTPYNNMSVSRITEIVEYCRNLYNDFGDPEHPEINRFEEAINRKAETQDLQSAADGKWLIKSNISSRYFIKLVA